MVSVLVHWYAICLLRCKPGFETGRRGSIEQKREMAKQISSLRLSFGIFIQGFILRPILYAIFISPLFDIKTLTCYADDKFLLVWAWDKSVLIRFMEVKLSCFFLSETKKSNRVEKIIKTVEKITLTSSRSTQKLIEIHNSFK